MIQGLGFTLSTDFFEMLENQMPGVKDLKKHLEVTIAHIWPVLIEEPTVLEEIMPILKEMLDASKNNADISDEKFVCWGNSLLNMYGPHLKKWIKALRDSPIKSLIVELEKLNFDLEEKQGKKVKEGLMWVKDMLKLTVELTIRNEPKSKSGFFDMFYSNSSGDDSKTEIMSKKSKTYKDEDNLKVIIILI